ncbi:MAG TPA: response regulator [Bacteroidetes bacterium]|nr:response regulator [Bacteroidota bacterium]
MNAQTCILVVDDEPFSRDIIIQALRLDFSKWEITFYEAANGLEGAEIARMIQPDLILMDVSMPVMTGTEAVSLLKAQKTTREIPVIAVTAHVHPRDRERFLAEGFDDYLPKPVDLDRLADCVRRHLKLD